VLAVLVAFLITRAQLDRTRFLEQLLRSVVAVVEVLLVLVYPQVHLVVLVVVLVVVTTLLHTVVVLAQRVKVLLVVAQVQERVKQILQAQAVVVLEPLP
jgi:hypothetical protein